MSWKVRVAFVVVVACVLGSGWWAVVALRKPSAAPQKKEEAVTEAAGNPVVVIDTSLGTIRVQLWPDKAPGTVRNFLRYMDEKHYDGTIFHRVIDDFMIQGGGFTPDFSEKPTREPIPNEARADAPNSRGTLAMARTTDVHSATDQFYINLKHNRDLDHRDQTDQGFGYCVFGNVIDGMDVVDRIAKVPTGPGGPFEKDRPRQTVHIHSIRRAD